MKPSLLGRIKSFLNYRNQPPVAIHTPEVVTPPREVVSPTIDQFVNKEMISEMKSLGEKVGNLASYSNLQEWQSDKDKYVKLSKAIAKDINTFVGKSARRKSDNTTIMDLVSSGSYTPVESTFVGFFDGNPAEAYAYIFKYHPIAYRCNDIIREEISNDGYGLRHGRVIAKKRLKEVHNLFKSQGLAELRLNICSHLKIYGNAYLIKVKDKNKKPMLKLLAPTRITPWQWDPKTEEILSWKYFIGNSFVTFTKDEIYHLSMFNPEPHKQIGDPPLQAALIDIETDFAAKGFNREVLEKGFMGGVVFSIEPPEGEDAYSEELGAVLEVVRSYIDSEFSGAQAGGRGLVLSHLRDVKNISPVGSYEGAFSDLKKENSKIICMCLGVPSEKLGVPRSENEQYIATLVEYGVNASFDKSITFLVDYVDEFLNEVYVKGMHQIMDIRFEAGGRFGSLTKTAAEVIKLLAEAGPLITVNQALEIILGWEPLSPDNPRGNWVLDNSMNRNAMAIPVTVDPEKIDLDLGVATGVSYKKISWDDFFTMTKEMKIGVFEVKDMTSAGEDELVSFLKVKKGKETYTVNA